MLRVLSMCSTGMRVSGTAGTVPVALSAGASKELLSDLLRYIQNMPIVSTAARRRGWGRC